MADFKTFIKSLQLTPKRVIMSVAGSIILAFGLYNIHSFSGVTEGGVLGMTLLLHHHFSISPALSGFILNAVCYIFGAKTLGRQFVAYSVISGSGFSLAYLICEQFPPVYPQIGDYPFIAATIGAVFVGVGVGLAVRAGGAPGGDDALAMGISALAKVKIQTVYLFTDLLVLGLSLTYIPALRLIFSLYTVVLSGQIVGMFQKKNKSKGS